MPLTSASATGTGDILRSSIGEDDGKSDMRLSNDPMPSNKVARVKSIAGPNVDDCLHGRERSGTLPG